jgi:hypothetical protein
MTFVQDAIRLLIGTRAVIEYTLANTHKMADVAIEIGKRLDWCHWIKTSAKVSKNTRMYQNGMTLPSRRARALAAGRWTASGSLSRVG